MYAKYQKTRMAAQTLGVGESTLEKWRVQGRGPAFIRMGSRVLYLTSDLEEFVRSKTVTPEGAE